MLSRASSSQTERQPMRMWRCRMDRRRLLPLLFQDPVHNLCRFLWVVSLLSRPGLVASSNDLDFTTRSFLEEVRNAALQIVRADAMSVTADDDFVCLPGFGCVQNFLDGIAFFDFQLHVARKMSEHPLRFGADLFDVSESLARDLIVELAALIAAGRLQYTNQLYQISFIPDAFVNVTDYFFGTR